jgi:hypothetical protein
MREFEKTDKFNSATKSNPIPFAGWSFLGGEKGKD